MVIQEDLRILSSSWRLWLLPRDKSHRHGPVAPLVSEHQARPIGMEPGREENAMSMTVEKTVRELPWKTPLPRESLKS